MANLSANSVAGPSRKRAVSATSSDSSSDNEQLKEINPAAVNAGAGGTSKGGLSVDEKGEVVKVPAFLNKLFSMVSNAATDELIYWAENGESFFIPNSERFGREMLPQYFKHSNFSSFVRQLNMYGFHKVPHLQTGVLQNQTAHELWEFLNPNFRRGQPGLLGNVTRKNNRPGQAPTGTSNLLTGVSGRHLITDGTTEGEAGPVVGPSGQMIDFQALANNMASIQRNQTTMMEKMSSIQESQQVLWQQQMEVREKQRAHDETIGLIVTFLERLFGTEGEGTKGLKEAMRRGGLGRFSEEDGAEDIGRKRRRLGIDRMISDGNEAKGQEYGNFKLPRLGRTASRKEKEEARADHRFEPIEEVSRSSANGSRSTSNPTPTPTTANTNLTLAPGHLSPISTASHLSPDPTSGDALALAPYQRQPPASEPLSPNSAAMAAAYNLDPSLLSTTIGSILQSPAAAQMFLNSLTHSAQGQALATPQQPAQPSRQGSFSSLLNGNDSNAHAQSDPTLALLSPLPHQPLQHLAQNHQQNQGLMRGVNDGMVKNYQDTQALGQDMDGLQESINDLVRSMGLDLPQNGEQGMDSEFDMDQFLADLAKGSGDVGVNGDGTLHAANEGLNAQQEG